MLSQRRLVIENIAAGSMICVKDSVEHRAHIFAIGQTIRAFDEAPDICCADNFRHDPNRAIRARKLQAEVAEGDDLLRPS
jgi:hypothetical protein